jgi:predicted RNase H-like nuclease (RuvC/YqgF family)
MSGQEFYDKEMARLRAENERLKTALERSVQNITELQARVEYLRDMLTESNRLLEIVMVGDRNV